MKFKIKLSNRLIMQLVLILALTGTAVLLDFYFENHPVTLTELNADGEEGNKEHSVVYLISQNFTLSVKSPVQSSTGSKFITQTHSKLIRLCHHLINLQALKSKKDVHRKPVYLTCHNLLFKQSYFSYPDDESLIS